MGWCQPGMNGHWFMLDLYRKPCFGAVILFVRNNVTLARYYVSADVQLLWMWSLSLLSLSSFSASITITSMPSGIMDSDHS
jgi:hypothetical protein